MDHAIFSMPTWAAIPPTNMIAWTKNAPILDVEGDIMAFAQVDNKFTTPYNWFIIPNSPTSQINKAGMCNILTPLIETSRFHIHPELFNCFRQRVMETSQFLCPSIGTEIFMEAEQNE